MLALQTQAAKCRIASAAFCEFTTALPMPAIRGSFRATALQHNQPVKCVKLVLFRLHCVKVKLSGSPSITQRQSAGTQ
jgi:hypothetical protein